MVLSYGFYDIIIKQKSLEEIENGLSAKLINDYKVTAGHFDENLIVIRAGMSQDDADLTIKELEDKFKLIHSKDFVCINGLYGLREKCDWLEEKILSEDTEFGKAKFYKNQKYYIFK